MGALTSKPYSFRGRPWEQKTVESIDVFDSLGYNVVFELRGFGISRILPAVRGGFNDDWITDKIRFFYDALEKQRILLPLVQGVSGFLEVSYTRALDFFFCSVKSVLSTFHVYLGSIMSNSYIFSISEFFRFFSNSSIFSVLCSSNWSFDIPFFYMNPLKTFFNSDIILIDTNLRFESPLFNYKLRRHLRRFSNKIVYSFGFFGLDGLLSNKVNMGLLFNWFRFYFGQSKFVRRLARYSDTSCLLGMNLLRRNSGLSIYRSLFTLYAKSLLKSQFDWSFLFNFVVSDLTALNLLMSGVLESNTGNNYITLGDSCLVSLFGDEVCFNSSIFSDTVYLGSHGSKSSSNFKLIIPVRSLFDESSSSEASSGFFNLWGKQLDFNFPGFLLPINGKLMSVTDFMSICPLKFKMFTFFKETFMFFRSFFVSSFHICKIGFFKVLGYYSTKFVCRDFFFNYSLFKFTPSIDFYLYLGNMFSKIISASRLTLSWFSGNRFFFSFWSISRFFYSYYQTDTVTRSSLHLSLAANRFRNRHCFY